MSFSAQRHSRSRPQPDFVIEAVLAFFLVIVVLTAAVARSAGSLAPIAIGMTVALNIMMAGGSTGANSSTLRSRWVR